MNLIKIHATYGHHFGWWSSFRDFGEKYVKNNDVLLMTEIHACRKFGITRKHIPSLGDCGTGSCGNVWTLGFSSEFGWGWCCIPFKFVRKIW